MITLHKLPVSSCNLIVILRSAVINFKILKMPMRKHGLQFLNYHSALLEILRFKHGTNDDFDKIVMDFRQCEKQAFLRGLVKDGRITEIIIGASDGLLNVMDRNNANKSEYRYLHAFINRAWDCKGNYSLWDETAERMFVL